MSGRPQRLWAICKDTAEWYSRREQDCSATKSPGQTRQEKRKDSRGGGPACQGDWLLGHMASDQWEPVASLLVLPAGGSPPLPRHPGGDGSCPYSPCTLREYILPGHLLVVLSWAKVKSLCKEGLFRGAFLDFRAFKVIEKGRSVLNMTVGWHNQVTDGQYSPGQAQSRLWAGMLWFFSAGLAAAEPAPHLHDGHSQSGNYFRFKT